MFAAILLAEQDGARLGMRQIVIAIWREMKKAGRLFDPADLGPWQDAIVAHAGTQRR